MSKAEAFAEADIVFADGERSVRQGLRQILIDQGYRSLRDYGTLEIVEEEIGRTLPDLIVMDAMMDGGEAMALANRIRAGELGINPFVVTRSYIGPDRRTKIVKEREGQKIPLIDVPNTLEAKVRGRPLSMEALREMIGEAMFEINEQRLKRHSYQIAFLVGEILPAFKANRVDDAAKKSIIRLSGVANEIGFRLKDSNFEHVSNLCQNLIQVTTAIRKDLRHPSSKDFNLLKPLSDAILISFNPDRNAAAMAGEIGMMLDKFGTKH